MNCNAIKPIFLAAALLAFCAAAPAAHADLNLTLNNPTAIALAGDVVDFTGTLTNTGSSSIDLYPSFALTNDPTGSNPFALSLDGNSPVFGTLNPPLTLAGGSTFSGDLFSVDVDGGAPPAIYAGTFSVLDGSSNELASAPLTVQVTAAGTPAPVPVGAPDIPEASPLALLAAGLLSMGLLAARRRTSL